MSTKTKKSKSSQIAELSRQAGILLMSAAVTMGMLELPDRSTRIIVPNQPAFAWANENDHSNQNTLRRESEETEQQYISYNVVQRTPSRSGRH